MQNSVVDIFPSLCVLFLVVMVYIHIFKDAVSIRVVPLGGFLCFCDKINACYRGVGVRQTSLVSVLE